MVEYRSVRILCSQMVLGIFSSNAGRTPPKKKLNRGTFESAGNDQNNGDDCLAAISVALDVCDEEIAAAVKTLGEEVQTDDHTEEQGALDATEEVVVTPGIFYDPIAASRGR